MQLNFSEFTGPIFTKFSDLVHTGRHTADIHVALLTIRYYGNQLIF